MKFLLTAMILFAFGQVACQRTDNYVATVDKLRNQGKLTAKAYPDKTFVGSVTGYYNKGSLVLINSLTDAEAAGTETLYYIKDGVLKKIFILAAQLESNKDWRAYFEKHKSKDNCRECHGQLNCIVTEITFDDKSITTITQGKETKRLNRDDETKLLTDVQKTVEELKVLLKELE
jgi:antitoxin component YwqK of YwqJK toxin-antitoxin module